MNRARHEPRHAHAARRGVLAVLLLAILAIGLGCDSSPTRTRCSRCGMYIHLAPGFEARAGERAYDTPKCLWRDIVDGTTSRTGAEVTEYYTRKPIAAEVARYVVGSDVLGPMGAELIPVAPADAARFAAEHGGRVLAPEAIDAALLSGL